MTKSVTLRCFLIIFPPLLLQILLLIFLIQTSSSPLFNILTTKIWRAPSEAFFLELKPSGFVFFRRIPSRPCGKAFRLGWKIVWSVWRLRCDHKENVFQKRWVRKTPPQKEAPPKDRDSDRVLWSGKIWTNLLSGLGFRELDINFRHFCPLLVG